MSGPNRHEDDADLAPHGVGQTPERDHPPPPPEASEHPAFALDRDLRYLGFNQAHAEVMRTLYGAEIVVGGRLTDYQTVAVDRETARANLERALAGERVVVAAYSGEPGRERRYFDVVHTPELHSSGAVIGVEVRAYDVTERQLTEEELRESAERYGLLFKNILEGFAYCRMLYDDAGHPDDFVYLAVNPAFERLTGITDVTGKRVTEAIPTIKAELPDLIATYGRVAQTGEAVEFDLDFTPLGIWLHISVFRPLQDHFVAVFTDATAHRLADRALHESEQRLRDITFSVADWVWEVDERGVYTYSSEKSVDFFGPMRGNVIGKTPFDLMPPDEAARVRPLFAAAMARKAPIVDLENWNLNAEGVRFCLLTNSVPILDDAGKLRGYRGADKDITERKRAEAALRESEDKFKYVFDHSVIGKSLTMPSGEMHVNRAFAAMLGYTPDELEGLPLQQVTHPEDVAASRQAMEDLASSRATTVRFVKRYLRRDGATVWADVSTSLRRDEEGVPLYFITSVVDVTERVRGEEEIRRLNAELEERVIRRTAELEAANKELEAFAYSVSHDLRAPLRAIDGFSRMVVEDAADKLEPKDVENLERVRAGAQRMAVLIDEILGLSRASRQNMSYDVVDVSGMAEGILRELRDVEPDRDVTTVVAPRLQAVADPTLLRIVLANLLGNSWKFTSAHAEALIEVGVTKVDGERAFFVRDDGAGFDPRYAKNLFGAFQRMHSPGQFEGHGVGLATVKRLVSRHGGRVWAEAEVEEGATFYFTLPRQMLPS